MKLWLCGMIRGDLETLKETVEPYIDIFDGLIFVVDSRASLLATNWLNDIKKAGKIIVKDWVNDHAHTSNEVLLSGVMNYGDFFIWIDETDKLNHDFAAGLKKYIKDWNAAGVGAVYLDHPFVMCYNDGVRFSNSPHWGISGIIGDSISLVGGGNKKSDFITNLRDKDVLRSGFLSPIKYWFCYPAFSNHTQLLYQQFGNDRWQEHENLRIKFRIFCSRELRIPLTVDGLKNYLIDNQGKYHPVFEHTLEFEVNLKDAFRIFVLNQPWQELAENRFSWSYFHWKKTGEVIQDPKKTGYVGIFNQYKIQKGEFPE